MSVFGISMPIADLPGDRREDPHVGRRDRVGDVLAERGDLLHLHRGAELDLVAGHRRATRVAGDLGVDVELLEHLGEPGDDLVGGLRPRLVHRAGLEHLVGRERVGDVARQRELLDARRQRRVRRGLGALLDLLVGRRLGLLGHDRLALALAERPVLQDRGVVGLVAAVLVHVVGTGHRPDATAGTAARERCRLLLGGDLGLGRRTAQQAVAQLREPGRHLVDRGAGDHQHAEDREQHQQGYDDQGAAQQVQEERGDHEADGAAGLLEVLGVPAVRLRHAVGDVHQAEHAEQQRRPADDLPAGRAVAVRVAQVAPGDEAQQQRDEPAEQADRPVHHGAGEVAHSPGQLPPDRGRDHDGEPEQEQPGAVTTVLGFELAGGVPDLADGRSQHVGDAEPHGDEPPAEGEAERCNRASPVADGARRGTARLARAALRCRLPAGLAAGRPGRGTRGLRAGLRSRLGGSLVPRRRWGRRTGRHGAESTQRSHQSHASHAGPGPRAYASMTTGMIIGRRRCLLETQRPTTRRIVCCSW